MHESQKLKDRGKQTQDGKKAERKTQKVSREKATESEREKGERKFIHVNLKKKLALILSTQCSK